MGLSASDLTRMCYQLQNRRLTTQEARDFSGSKIGDEKILSASRRYLNQQISAAELPREFYPEERGRDV